MAAPNITAITPPDGFTSFPTGEKISILFDREISEFLVENSVSLVGPDTQVVTGVDFEEKLYRLSTEANFAKALESLHLKGEIPIEIEILKCDEEGEVLADQNSFSYDIDIRSRLLIRPKSFLQEKTQYRLLISGSSLPGDSWSYLGSRSVYDAEPDVTNSVNSSGIIRALGNYTGTTNNTIVLIITKTGTSTTCKAEWHYDSSPSITHTLLPLSGRNKIATNAEIYLEFLGGDNAAFTAGDIWTINLKPVEYLGNTYKVDFETAADQVKELPTTVSQSPIGLTAPSAEEVLSAQTEFQLIKIEPEYGASNISLNTKQIIFTFNKNLDPTSITADTVRLFRNEIDQNQDPIDVGYSWIVSGKKLIINITRE